MAQRSVRSEILALSIPAIASNITTPLLGLADVAVVGHIGSAVYIGAIALGGAVMNMLYWVFSFLRLGSSGMAAQAYGAGDSSQLSDVFYRGLAVSAALSVVVLALHGVAGDAVIGFMDAEESAAGLAGLYVSICVWGAPAVLGTYVLSGWLLGMQNSRGPMWMALVTNIVNISCSLVFVFGFGMDIGGVATGTVVAQWTGFAVGLWIVARRYGVGRADWRRVMRGDGIRRFFTVNLDIFLRTVCLVAVTIWFTHAGAVQGNLVLAANALLMQFFMFFFYFTDGFAFAGEALSGKYLGACDRLGLKRTVRGLFVAGTVMSLVFTAIYFLAGDIVMGLLTDEADVVSAAKVYFPWVLTIPLLGFAAFTWDGIFGGMTMTRGMLVSMAVATGVFFACYSWLTPIYGNHGLWCSFVAYLSVRGIVQTAYYWFKREKY